MLIKQIYTYIPTHTNTHTHTHTHMQTQKHTNSEEGTRSYLSFFTNVRFWISTTRNVILNFIFMVLCIATLY